MKACFQIAECSLSYAKIMQASAMKVYFQIAECNLSYAKIVQIKHNAKHYNCFVTLVQYVLTSIHPKDVHRIRNGCCHFLQALYRCNIEHYVYCTAVL